MKQYIAGIRYLHGERRMPDAELLIFWQNAVEVYGLRRALPFRKFCNLIRR